MRTLLTVLFLLFSSIIIAQTGEKNFIDQNYIEVTGKAEMEIIPDEIYISILLNEKNYKGKNFPELEKSMFDKLSDLGIDLSKDLAIKDLLSDLNYI